MNDTQVSSPVATPESEQNPSANKRIALQVSLTLGDITEVNVPVVMAGHYKGVAPIAAVGALDKALDYWISKACDRGMMGGDLGELFFIPVFQNQVAAKSILLGGMGEYGKFNYDALCYLTMNASYGISDLAQERFASVLIGSGEGGLSVEESLKGMLSGICDGLHHHVEEKRLLKEFVLVERNPDRHKEIWEILETFAEKQPIGNLHITVKKSSDFVTPVPTSKTTVARRPSSARPPGAQFVNRVTIERSPDGYQFSALMDSAVVPVRKVEVQAFFADGIAERLRLVSSIERQEEFGRLLHTYVFPEDFERLIANRQTVPGEQQTEDFRPLTLVLDSTTAALPWEMACFASSQQQRIYFGTDLKLTRQFRTMLSGAPGIAPPVNKSLKILVIADPAPEDDLRLPGAREEGQKVVDVVKSLKEELKGIDIEIEARIGPSQCNPIDILSLVLNRTFDVIHFSGHGIFNPKYPNHSGWVFSHKCILSAREIFRVRQVPRLVFANACFSAVVSEKRKPNAKQKDQPLASAEETNRKLAGLAEAFFERGVQNYIGTGWKVDDAAATEFAESFYNDAVKGELIGDALATARKKIFDQGSTWGAYQQYGQSNVRLTLHPVVS